MAASANADSKTITVAPLPVKKKPPGSPRVVEAPRSIGLDAFRGFVMLAMVSGGFGIAEAVRSFPDHKWWQAVGFQFEHVEWVGWSFWDFIQPAFMFMVGASMAHSMAARTARGATWGQLVWHAILRSIVLILLGVFLSSNGQPQTNWTFVNVLTQIGLGYFFVFLLWNRAAWIQWIAALAILGGYWALFYFYPAPPDNFDPTTVGLEANWPVLTGRAAHWNKNTNVATRADQTILNWFPQRKDPQGQKIPFTFNGGGYQTLNFIPSIATMIFGLIAAEFLRGPRRWWVKLLVLIFVGAAGIGAGWALDHYGWCPLVKRIWTPSWALFSGGVVVLTLTLFVGLTDMVGWSKWAFPFVVIGANSLFVYVAGALFSDWIARSLQTHLGQEIFTKGGLAYEPIVRSVAVLLILWLMCFWMYRRRLFVRI